MKMLILLAILVSCGKDPEKGQSMNTEKVSPILNPATEYMCKQDTTCSEVCANKKQECYGICESVNNGRSLDIRNCKVFQCDGNYNTCMNEVYSR